MKLFAASTHTILDGEMDVHRTYMKRLGISLDEAENTPVALDNRSYTSYMLRAAYEGGEAEVMAAILSCALSYEAIAKEILKSGGRPASILRRMGIRLCQRGISDGK